jgi:hypothetical protein
VKNRFLAGAIAFTFFAHGVAMLLMAALLLPLVPGGGTEVERMARIAASPLHYRIGWLGWQVTAASDIVLAIALFRATREGRARRAGLVQLVLVVLAVIPDQLAQFLLVTRGVELARAGDAAAFIAFENTMFPITSGWAAALYTLAAIAWAFALRASGLWNRALAWISPPMLILFCAISVAPLLPVAIRPSAELIGGGNAVAFVILEGWFVAVFVAVRRSTHASRTA